MLKIFPSKVSGKVRVPSSKSCGHRALICASLSDGVSVIENLGFSKDIIATIDCLRLLGADIRLENDKATVKGINPLNVKSKDIYCNESGSTLRFLIPLFTLSDSLQTFSGSGKLMERPQSVYENLYKENNCLFKFEDSKLLVRGPLKAGEYHLDGGVSSQFFTGLLFALPLLKEDSKLIIDNKIESKSYIDLTIDILKKFNISVEFKDNTIYIPGSQKYKAADYTCEGDYSSAAFLKLLNDFNGPIEIEGLAKDSLQGDRVFFDFAKRLKDEETVFDLADCPDLGPVTMVLACLSGKQVKLNNISRLRIKESDRVGCMIEELNKLGFNLYASENEMIVSDQHDKPKENVIIDCHNDHRIAMSLACLASVYEYPVTLRGEDCVKKSYPDFFEDLKNLGVRMEKI